MLRFSKGKFTITQKISKDVFMVPDFRDKKQSRVSNLRSSDTWGLCWLTRGPPAPRCYRALEMWLPQVDTVLPIKCILDVEDLL